MAVYKGHYADQEAKLLVGIYRDNKNNIRFSFVTEVGSNRERVDLPAQEVAKLQKMLGDQLWTILKAEYD